MFHDPLVTRVALPHFLVPYPMADLAGPLEAVVLASEPCDGDIVALGELVAMAHPDMPPGRVRHMFKKLDANGDRVLTRAELESGFTKEFGQPAPHVVEAIPKMFDAHASHDEKLGKIVLRVGDFSRFYAELLFKHFDADNNGTLQREEAQAALRFLTKQPSGGAAPEVVLALPASAEEGGKIHLPFSWFWDQYRAME